MILQDAPFFVFRVILITYYRLISSMNIFCTMKNTLVIALQVQYICSHKFGHKYCKYTVHNPSKIVMNIYCTMKNTLVMQVKYICKYCTNISANIAQMCILQPIASIKILSPPVLPVDSGANRGSSIRRGREGEGEKGKERSWKGKIRW